MPKLSTEQRSEAIGMLRANASVTHIANIFGVYTFCIYKLKTTFQATGTVKDRQRSDRPRVSMGPEDLHIRTTHLHNRFKSETETSRAFRPARPVIDHIKTSKRSRHLCHSVC